MKHIIIIFIIFILMGCSARSVITNPQPTGDDTKDIYLQEWITSYNVTFCEKIRDVEYYLDGYFCRETMTDNKYYIPKREWDNHNLELLFLRVSKAQVRAKMDKDQVLENYLCNNSNMDCNQFGQPNIMSELQPWKEQ
ncbi:MAG: hypothetical protein OXM55_03215 [Bdellovibrionales bacterium]|nr:hypothetical protein [Bdellovibrionales bacterium]